MATVWFVLIAFMLIVYVVLDGFDLGVGVDHLFVARGEEERRTVLKTIGTVWVGNEAWLIGAGGAPVPVFPTLYAARYSGFFLPLMTVLWLLMGRGISLEFRNHVDHPVWRPFWDVAFSVSSVLLPIFFGAALGHVVRALPLDASGELFAALRMNLRLGPPTGIIEWCTLSVGLLASAALTTHGSLWIALSSGAVKVPAALEVVLHRPLEAVGIAPLLEVLHVGRDVDPFEPESHRLEGSRPSPRHLDMVEAAAVGDQHPAASERLKDVCNATADRHLSARHVESRLAHHPALRRHHDEAVGPDRSEETGPRVVPFP